MIFGRSHNRIAWRPGLCNSVFETTTSPRVEVGGTFYLSHKQLGAIVENRITNSGNNDNLAEMHKALGKLQDCIHLEHDRRRARVIAGAQVTTVFDRYQALCAESRGRG